LINLLLLPCPKTHPLKILKATRFDKILKGGSTMPWVVFASDGHTEEAYVVKLFTQKTIEQQNAVAKEVYGSYLAKTFGNSTPEIALIEFDNDFLSTLNPIQIQRLDRVHSGLKFASVYEPTMINYSNALHRKHLKEYDMGNIYALDCILYNVDRGRRTEKPNLLIDDERFLLIDHEQCLHFADGQEGHFSKILSGYRNNEIDYPYQHHLFYGALKKMRKSQKLHLFEEFLEYLSRLNTTEFKVLAVGLINLNISVGDYLRIYDYLCFLKSNVSSVRKALLSSIS
jgi:hypothetical protein